MDTHKTRDSSAWARRLWRERRPLVLSAVLLVFGLPLVVGLAQLGKNKSSPALDGIRQAASADTASGEYEAAYEKLKHGVVEAKTKADQVALYGDLAAAAATANKPIEAIDYLMLKHELDPSTAPGDAYMLAVLYDQKGDTAKAILQYKAAVEYYQSLPDSPETDARIVSIKAIIAEREGSSQ